MAKSKYTQTRTLLVGVRFNMLQLPEENDILTFLGVRQGSGNTFVVEQTPISGPIYQVEDPTEVWAYCGMCKRVSKSYKSVTKSRYTLQWATKHRCPR